MRIALEDHGEVGALWEVFGTVVVVQCILSHLRGNLATVGSIRLSCVS